MTNFDLDDPLGDLLSDGSNDSFFEEAKPAAKRSSLSKTPEKKNISDLFGLEESKSSTKKDDWLGLKKSESPVKKASKKITFEEDDDILNILDSKKPETSKKSALIESLKNPTKEEDKKAFSLDDLLKESKFKKNDPIETTQSTPHINQRSEGFGLSSLEAPREGRRRPKTAAVADPLGLFSEPEPEPKPEPKPRKKEPETEILFQASEMKTKSTPNIASDVPDWLGGAAMKPNKSETTVETYEAKKSETVQEQLPVESLITHQKLAASHFDYQNASLALQQQESQVLMALQLRKYEDNLSEIQNKQQEVIMKQEQHFNSLLERQFAKQSAMENNMRLQQERINNHIQMLIGQPSVPTMKSAEDEKFEELKKSANEETTKQYEDLINTLKQRHHDELFLLEESYKKQLTTLEQSMESMENHLKMELDTITIKSREKMEQIESEHESEISKQKRKIEELYELHQTEIKQMRENNNRILEEVKYEYNTIIENIKMSKQTEASALQETTAYSHKLDSNLKLLDINSRTLLEMKHKVESDYGILSVAREESLKAKEEEIKLMRLALEKSRDSADSERAQLMSLVRNLEIKLAEQSQNSREERFALQQAASTLTARTAALDREADFNRASIEREREQMKTLRESILADQDKMIQEITEQKLALHTEKIKLETSIKLGQNYDSQRAKVEMEAAMQVAKEAAEMTDRERDNLLRQIREVEILKRNLIDREKKVSSRELELEKSLEHANRKNAVGERALEEARMLQINYNERLREIQAQMASLTARERKLAEEKISISRERLALHNNVKQMKKCSLCAIDNSRKFEDEDEDPEDEMVEHDIPRFISMSDADLFRLQLQRSEDQLASTHNTEDRQSLH
ncbi:PREDICTED: uncharacterized protein PFB0145c [Nicrophorus vespilloides]|uniref:Uncharacterized protein PFB0145c n=1 Tax=Nicrophorus vespilloides TaxID=110193 RepID=A0ABM1N260_NICVS|nr:PREDICTED: uncharacterized protein PFB0145c [Nicrophorus vespilloides]